MECYACDQAATRHCPRCTKPYCPGHGDNLCAECLDPVNAAPSSTVFRASLFALLAGSVLALWLLIRPPSVPGDEGSVIRPEPTPQVTPAGSRGPTQRPGVTATPGPSGAASATPGSGSASATPADETPDGGPIEYTVQEGDTWFGIAEAYGVSAEDLVAVNGLTLDDFLHPGDVIAIPQ